MKNTHLRSAILVGLSFWTIQSSMAHATTGFTHDEAKKVVKTLRNMTPAARAEYKPFLDHASISEKEIAPGKFRAFCEVVLKYLTFKSKPTSADIAAGNFITIASTEAQVLLRKTLTEGVSLKEALIHQYIDEKAYKFDTDTQLGWVMHPTFLPPPKYDIDLSEVVKTTREALADVVKAGGKPFDLTYIYLDHFQHSGKSNQLSFSFDLIYKNGERQSFFIDQWPLGSISKERFLSDFIVAAMGHREVLTRESYMRQEINMLAYTIKKLIRVTDNQTRTRLNEFVKELPEVNDGGFQAHPQLRAAALLHYLDVKKELLTMSQKIQQQIAAGQLKSAESSDSDKQATSGDNQNTIKIELGLDDAVKIKPKKRKDRVAVAFSRSRPTRFIGRTGTLSPNGYYYPTYDVSGNSIETMAWIMDPYYMMSHPWFWGTRDDSVMAPFLMFDIMADRSGARAAEPLFSSNPGYDARMFDRPVEPIYYRGNDLPVADPWNAPARPDMVFPVADNSGAIGWVRSDGVPQVVDKASLTREWNNFTQGSDGTWDPKAPEASVGNQDGTATENGFVETEEGSAVTDEVLQDQDNEGFEEGQQSNGAESS